MNWFRQVLTSGAKAQEIGRGKAGGTVSEPGMNYLFRSLIVT